MGWRDKAKRLASGRTATRGNPKDVEQESPEHEALEQKKRLDTALQGAQIADRCDKERKRSERGGGVSSTQNPQQQLGHPHSLQPGHQQTQIPRRPIDTTDPRTHWNNSSAPKPTEASRLGSPRTDIAAELEAPTLSTISLISSAVPGSAQLTPSPFDCATEYSAYKPVAPPLPSHTTTPFSDSSQRDSPPQLGASTTQVVELSTHNSLRGRYEADGKASKPDHTITNLGGDKNWADQSSLESSEEEDEPTLGHVNEPGARDVAPEDAHILEQIGDLISSFNSPSEDTDAQSTCAIANGDGVDEESDKENTSSENELPENEKDDSDSEKEQDLPIQGVKSSPSKLRKRNLATSTTLSATDKTAKAPPPLATLPQPKSDIEQTIEMKIKNMILESRCQEIIPKRGADAVTYVKLLVDNHIYLREQLRPIQQAVEKASGLRAENKTLSQKLQRRKDRLEESQRQLTIRGTENVNLREQVMKLENERRGLEAAHRSTREQLVAQHEKKLSDSWITQQERHRGEITSITEINRKELRKLGNVHTEELYAQKAESTKRLDAAREQLNREKDRSARERSAWDRKWKDRENNHTKEISENEALHRKVVNGLQSRIDTMEEEWTKKMDDSQADWLAKEEEWRNTSADMTLRHEEQLAAIASQHQQKLVDQRAQLEGRISEQARKYNSLKLTSEQEKMSIQDSANRTLEETEARQKATIKAMEEDYASKLKNRERHLRNNNEQLKRALVQREHVKGLTDPQVEELFQRLEIRLFDFCKMIKWDLKKQNHWPINESAFQEYGNSDGNTGVKRMKQNIVLSCVWAILHDNIFCSPFRIFGTPGDDMHDEWTGKFGKDLLSKDFPDWPKPSPKSEKMRYNTIKQWREALQQSNPTGANGLRKDDFEHSLNTTVSDISEAIARVASVSVNEQEHLKNFVKIAADDWLEICSQRYRVLVVLPNGDGNILKSGWKKSGTVLKLIARPEVRRIGVAQGEELGREEVIGDWTGSENVWKRG